MNKIKIINSNWEEITQYTVRGNIPDVNDLVYHREKMEYYVVIKKIQDIKRSNWFMRNILCGQDEVTTILVCEKFKEMSQIIK